MSKPIDLIVANVMHDAQEADAKIFDLAEEILSKVRKGHPLHDLMVQERKSARTDHLKITARAILCQIAHDAEMDDVLASLAAVGAPATLDMIKEGLTAVADRKPKKPVRS